MGIFSFNIWAIWSESVLRQLWLNFISRNYISLGHFGLENNFRKQSNLHIIVWIIITDQFSIWIGMSITSVSFRSFLDVWRRSWKETKCHQVMLYYHFIPFQIFTLAVLLSQPFKDWREFNCVLFWWFCFCCCCCIFVLVLLFSDLVLIFN